VFLAIQEINNTFVKTLVVIILLAFSITTFYVVGKKYQQYLAKSQSDTNQPDQKSDASGTSINQTIYKNNTTDTFGASVTNTPASRINKTSVIITAIIAVSVILIIIFIFAYGGSSIDPPHPSPTPSLTPSSTLSPTPSPTAVITPTPTVTPGKVASAWLIDQEVYSKNGVYIYFTSVDDNRENEHTHRLFGASGAEITYDLGGVYKTLTGVWYICLRDAETTVSSGCKIYADDELVYTAPAITGGDSPIEFSIPINYCDYLTICFTSGNGEAELGDLWLQ